MNLITRYCIIDTKHTPVEVEGGVILTAFPCVMEFFTKKECEDYIAKSAAVGKENWVIVPVQRKIYQYDWKMIIEGVTTPDCISDSDSFIKDGYVIKNKLGDVLARISKESSSHLVDAKEGEERGLSYKAFDSFKLQTLLERNVMNVAKVADALNILDRLIELAETKADDGWEAVLEFIKDSIITDVDLHLRSTVTRELDKFVTKEEAENKERANASQNEIKPQN